MKTILSFVFSVMVFFGTLAQNPVIAGDTMLCPNGTGSAVVTNNQIYDSYTWYWKYWFSSDQFNAIPGANSASFTYDWATYDQALLKVVVTLGGYTYESNTIQIDSYSWVGLTVGFEDSPNVSIDPDTGNVNLCEGTGFTIQVYQPYTNVQWYRDGQPIAGANDMQLHVTEAGGYYVVASPGFCPDDTSSTEGLPIVVQIDTNCGLGTDHPQEATFNFYPNPVKDFMIVSSGQYALDTVTLFNLSGQVLLEERPGIPNTKIDFAKLSSGMYILEVRAGGNTQRIKVVKN